LERIEQLQGQADRLRATNMRLAREVHLLRQTVGQLRREALLHARCQPPVTLPSANSEFDDVISCCSAETVSNDRT